MDRVAIDVVGVVVVVVDDDDDAGGDSNANVAVVVVDDDDDDDDGDYCYSCDVGRSESDRASCSMADTGLALWSNTAYCCAD